MQSLFEMLIGVGTSLVATGIGVLAAWLWSRKKQDDESTNRIHRLEILVESLSERADNLIENLGIKFDNLAKKVGARARTSAARVGKEPQSHCESCRAGSPQGAGSQQDIPAIGFKNTARGLQRLSPKHNNRTRR